MVQFKSFTSGAAPASPQISPLVAALLRKSFSDQPIRHPVQGLDRLGKAALAAFLQRKEKTEGEEKKELISQEIRDAFAKGFDTPGQVFEAEVAASGPEGLAPRGRIDTRRSGSPDAVVRALLGSSNLDVLGLGAELFGQTETRRSKAKVAKTLAGVNADAASTLAGVNVDKADVLAGVNADAASATLVSSGAAVNVQLSDKTIVLGRKRKDGKVELQNADGTFRLAPPKSQIIGLNVQAATLEELTPLKARQDAAAGLQEGVSAIANISVTMDELEKATSAGGLSGLAIEKVGGFLGQFSKAAEEGFAAFFGDATPQEVQAIRTRARVIVAQMLSEITGEESGRFTEAERALAVEALKSLDPNASPPQIRSALAVGLELQLLSRDRQFMVAGVAPKFDLETDEGLNSKGAELEKLGLKPREIVPILKRMVLQRSLMKRIQ